MERVIGPVRGYYIATYACAVDDGGEQFVGYARVCRERPASFWDAPVIFDVIADQPNGSEDEAHRVGFALASERLAEVRALSMPRFAVLELDE